MKDNQCFNRAYHQPVMESQVVQVFSSSRKAVLFDGTLGGGGHADRLLQSLPEGSLYIGVDRDREALDYCRQRLEKYENIVFYHGVFDDFNGALREAGVDYVDGIFLDLGVSSHHLDEDQRGFSFRKGLKLDMRMDTDSVMTAADIVNTYPEAELYRIFKEYGEERFSGCIARETVKERQKAKIDQTDTLLEIIRRCIRPPFLVKSYARIFQALRIEVNNELEVLSRALETGLDVLRSGGKLAVITYHSLEDRMVKRFIRGQENPCQCPPDLPYCVCGRKPRMKRWRPEVITADTDEIKQNPRARSAKLRVGVKL